MASKSKVAIEIASAFDAKGFKQADTATQKLNKQVKSLAKNFGLAFGAATLSRYAKDAVMAFAADDKAAQMLTKSLQNLGLGFESVNVKAFISELEQTFGVVDDELRPAFQKLLTTTGSVAESQKLLKTALNLSAASGKDVVTVASDLSKGYVGQTRSLAKYGLGLTQAEIKAMKFADIQEKIDSLFSGQASLAAASYSGQIDKLSIAADNAKEVIGKGLVDAIKAFNTGGAGGGGGIDGSIEKVDQLSQGFADALVTGSRFQKLFLGLAFGPNKFQNFVKDIKAFKEASKEVTQSTAVSQFFNPAMAQAAAEKADKKRAAAAAASLKKRLAAEKSAAAKIAKSQKDLNTLKKAGSIFDLDQIQIIAALKGKVSDEDRKRLELQLALETGNVEQAQKLTYQLAISQGLTESLAKTLASLPAAKNPFASWAAYLDTIEAQAKRIAGMGGGAGSMGGGYVEKNGMTFGVDPFVTERQKLGEIDRASMAPVIVNVTLDGQELTSKITTNQQNNSLSGITPTEQRLFGSF